jgi:NDP-sugar pyrophosphorylase family protein
VKAVVLVGGEGTRLRPLTLTTPKQMLPIVGVPMIERVLGHLGRHGIDEAVLSLGYLPDAFVQAYPHARVAGVGLSYAVEPEPLDTAGAIRFAATAAGVHDTFVVVNGDVLTDLDVSALVAFHRERRAEATIALHPVADPSAFGVVPTDLGGRVTAFVEKPPKDEAPTNRINAGTYVLEPEVLDRIAEGRRVSIEREVFPAMVGGGRLFADADESYWLDCGTPASYLQANLDLLGGRRGAVHVPEPASVADEVWVSGAVEVAGTVTGPCWLGDGVVVADGATVTGSAVGPGCVIEGRATVTGSVLLPGARVAAGSVVSGSVLGPGAVVGERCEVRPLSVLGALTVVPSGTMVDGKRVPE